jgi:uncharacterized protein (TIGR02391 family)
VFEAFREVEVAVRSASRLSDTDIGVPLMRKAFDKATGRLRDKAATEGERETLAHLFAGAMGTFKNPVSHKKVVLEDAHEAIEMVIIARAFSPCT